jgi:hypothetical protein
MKIMKIGLEGDKRKFRKATRAQKEAEDSVTKDIPDEKTKWPKCHGCGMDITGSKWRVAAGVYECFRCHNE